MSDLQPGAKPGPDELHVDLPSDEVFLEDTAQSVAGADAQFVFSAEKPRPPGPGIWESIAWMLGVHLMQLVAAAAAAVVLVGAFLATTGFDRLEKTIATPDGLSALTKAVAVFFAANLIYVLAAAQLGTVILGLAAIRLRFGRRGWTRPGIAAPGGPDDVASGSAPGNAVVATVL